MGHAQFSRNRKCFSFFAFNLKKKNYQINTIWDIEISIHMHLYIFGLCGHLSRPHGRVLDTVKLKQFYPGKNVDIYYCWKCTSLKKPRFFYSLLWKIETYKKTQLKAKIVNRKRVEKPPNFFWWNKPKRIFLFNISIRCNTYCICAKLYFNMKCIFLNVNLLKFWAVYTHIQILYLKAFALLLIR